MKKKNGNVFSFYLLGCFVLILSSMVMVFAGFIIGLIFFGLLSYEAYKETKQTNINNVEVM